jgi:hypothetical protein
MVLIKKYVTGLWDNEEVSLPSIILSWPPGMKQTALSISRAITTVFSFGERRALAIALTLSLSSITARKPYYNHHHHHHQGRKEGRETLSWSILKDLRRKASTNGIVHQGLDAFHGQFLKSFISNNNHNNNGNTN